MDSQIPTPDDEEGPAAEAPDGSARVPDGPLPSDRELQVLEYFRHVRQRRESFSLWKCAVRLIGGVMAAVFLSGYIGGLLAMTLEAHLIFVGLAAAVALFFLIRWELAIRGGKQAEGSKDRRATMWRQSASRFDSSGVTMVDPHSASQGEDR